MTWLCWYTQNKLLSKFSVDSEVAFVNYARFTVSHCCIGHYVAISISTWKIHKFGDYVPKQVNLQEKFSTQTLHYVPKGFYWHKNLNFLKEKWGDEAVDHKMDL